MKRSSKIIFIFCIVIYFLLGLSSVFLKDLVIGDENWHFTASSLVAQGKIPYRDFAYFHMPLLPYFYAIGMYIFGPNLIIGRLISFLLGLFTIIFIYKAATRLKGEYAGIFAILPVVFNFNVIHMSSLFHWGALEVFLVSLFCFCLVSHLKPEIKYSICTALLVLIQGVLYFIGPLTVFTPLFIIFVALINKKKTRVITACVISYLSTSLLLYLPSLLLAPREFLFGTLTHYFSTDFVFSLSQGFTGGYNFALYIYDHIKLVLIVCRNYYILIVFLLLMGTYGVYNFFHILKNKRAVLSLIRQYQIYVIFIMLIIFSIIYHLILFVGVVAHYLWYFPYHTLPAWVILFGCSLAKGLEYFKTHRQKIFFIFFVFWAISLNLFTQNIETWISSPTYSGAKFLNTVSQAIQRNSEPEDRVFAFVNGYVLQANRQIFINTIFDVSGTSSYHKLTDEQAKEHKLLSPNILLSYFKEKKAKVVVLERPGRIDTMMNRDEVKKVLSQNYYLAETIYKYPEQNFPSVEIYKVR